MYTTSRQDLDNIFGRDSVTKWADINNKNDPDEINTRIAWARGLAFAYVNSRLRDGPYAVPFTAPYDPVIVDLEARQSGILLYDGRRHVDSEGNDDADSDMHRSKVEAMINQLITGIVRLDIETVSEDYPQVIE
jgi:hypothetical protein